MAGSSKKLWDLCPRCHRRINNSKSRGTALGKPKAEAGSTREPAEPLPSNQLRPPSRPADSVLLDAGSARLASWKSDQTSVHHRLAGCSARFLSPRVSTPPGNITAHNRTRLARSLPLPTGQRRASRNQGGVPFMMSHVHLFAIIFADFRHRRDGKPESTPRNHSRYDACVYTHH